MFGIADLHQGINQGILPFGLECKVEGNKGAGGWVTLTLPVDWDRIPCVFDLHVIPWFLERRNGNREEEVGEEGESREPVGSHWT